MSALVAAVGVELDPATRAWVTEATAHLSCAGPDGVAVAIGERCGLGHALLRVGTSTMAQPLTLDGRVWCSADLRLDGRASLISSLRARGLAAGSDSDDAELLLHARAVWGERMLEHVAGDFAFALWDSDRGRLLCARDQIGVAPLHYAMVGDQLLVASAPDALLLHDGVSAELDEEALADFLLVGYATDFAATAFAAVRRLPPAHVLEWADGQFRLRRYWRAPELEPLLRLSRPAEYGAQFRQVLEMAVADRVTTEPLAVQLSGGVDSTSVAALARRARGVDAMRAVTAIAGPAGDLETGYARQVADALGIPLDAVDESTLRETDPFAEPEVLTPEPTRYRWTGLDYRMASTVAAHCRTCLTGMAGDALLGFVPWYWAQWMAGGHPLRLAAAWTDHVRLFGERPRPQLRTSLRTIGRRAPHSSVPGWMDASLAARVGADERVRSRAAQNWDRRGLSRDPGWQTWFVWGDPSYTRLPLRFRHPFTDLRLLDLLARIPPDPWLADKRILRDAMAGLLPDAVRSRPKTPLGQVARAGTGPDATRKLAELVRATPEAGRLLDREALVAALLSPSAPLENFTLARPLGLVHWLRHWRPMRSVSLVPAGAGPNVIKEELP